MAKAVFRPGELTELSDRVMLQLPEAFELSHLYPPSEQVSEKEGAKEEVYSGPTADDLRREAEEFKARWELEKETMIAASKAEAERIIKEAEREAARRLDRIAAEEEERKRRAEEEAAALAAGAEKKAAEMEAEARAGFEDKQREAEEAGRAAGYDEGYAEGKAEVERLVGRIQVILERAQNLRAEVLADTEQQIIDLALLISRKVIKTISESQKTVVLQNIAQALKKVKARGAILIRVNIADLKLASEHSKTFIQMMEGARGVQIVEDSTVDPGGCIIETDFGEIDARISSQLAELEAKILELSPIKGKAKPVSPSAARVAPSVASAAPGGAAMPEGEG
jgi:flagellar assembly protein FliH